MHGKLRIQSIDTTVSFNRLLEVAETTVTYPPSVTPNSKVKGILEKRVETIKNDTGIDWGTAETLAYGTLLQDGIDVRISGEDSGRGTFSHRMILINDAKTAEHYDSTTFS